VPEGDGIDRSTGLPSQRSASSARRTIERFVPTWTIASTSGPFSSSRMIGRSGASGTSAIEVAVGQRSPLKRMTSKPPSSKYRVTCRSEMGW
jgi:hypothetical protein